MLNASKKAFALLMLGLVFGFAACSDSDSTGPAPITRSIGGTITGLTGELQLRLNVDGESFDIITVENDGEFTFDEEVPDGSDYEVEPFGSLSNCSPINLTNSTGTADGNVTNIQINCN